jgi:hypothetical protein
MQKEASNRSRTWQNAQASRLLIRNKTSTKIGKEKQKGRSRFLGSEDGSIPAKIENLILSMAKNLMEAVGKDKSLRYLMSNLKDFEAQKTMLQMKAKEIGLFMD